MFRSLRQRVFYGWWMVLAAAGIQFLTSGLLNQSFGAYVAVMREEFGWKNTAFSAAYSLQQIESGLLGPVQGWFIDRVGPRGMMRLGIVIFGAGFMLLSQIHSLTAFYAVFIMMAFGASLAGFFPLTVALVQWFEKKRSRALSTMSLGFAFGGVVVPAIAISLETFGWRETAFVSGVAIILIGLPLSQVIRRRPEDHGEVVDGIRQPQPAAAAAPRLRPQPLLAPERDFTAAEAVRTPAFWFISFGHASALFVVGAVNIYAISHMKEDLGYSVATASLVITFMTTVQVAGMVAGGYLGDKVDKRLIAFGCMAMHTAGLLLLAYAVALPMILAFAVLHGFAWGARGPLMQAIRADYFGRSSFGMIMGISSIIVTLGNVVGPMLAGFLSDSTGSYQAAFTILALMTACGSVFFLLCQRPVPPPRRSDAERQVEALAGDTRA
jgi:MFS family permease